VESTNGPEGEREEIGRNVKMQEGVDQVKQQRKIRVGDQNLCLIRSKLMRPKEAGVL